MRRRPLSGRSHVGDRCPRDGFMEWRRRRSRSPQLGDLPAELADRIAMLGFHCLQPFAQRTRADQGDERHHRNSQQNAGNDYR